MTVRTKSELKVFFANGKVPNQDSFWDLIDSLMGVIDPEVHSHDHTELTNLNSALYSHLTSTQLTDLTDGGNTTLHAHNIYVRKEVDDVITAQHTFSPSSLLPPFILSENAQGQTVVGLKSDQLNKSVIAGQGLTGGGGLSSDITLNVGAGAGISVGVDTVGLITPGTLSTSSINDATNNHTHAITNTASGNISPNTILKSDANGDLELSNLTTVTSVFATVNLQTPQIWYDGSVTIDPTEGIYLSGPQYGINIDSSQLKSSDYASQTTGWGISPLGGGDFRYLFADELHVRAFIADLEQALAGLQIITKSVAAVAEDFLVPDKGSSRTLKVVEFAGFTGQVFADGDIVRLRRLHRPSSGNFSVGDAWGTVIYISRDGTLNPPVQSYTFTRSVDPNGGNLVTNATIETGSLALDYGQTSGGIHEVNAVDGALGVNAPYSQVASWTTHPATGMVTRTRTGNLTGLGFGIGGEYGFFAGNGTNPESEYVRFSNTIFEAHNLSLKLYSGTSNVISLISGTNPYLAIGNPIPDDYLSETGIWIGKDSSDNIYKMYVGSISLSALNRGFKWDGSEFTVKGNIIADGGLIGGWSIGTTKLSSTGVNLLSGSTAYIAFGDNWSGAPTIPTSPTSGTGIYIDKTGLYGLLSNAEQIKISAADGKLTASGVSLSALGLRFSNISLDQGNKITFGNTSGVDLAFDIGNYFVSGASGSNTVDIHSYGIGSTPTDMNVKAEATSGKNSALTLTSRSINVDLNNKTAYISLVTNYGLVINQIELNAADILLNATSSIAANYSISTTGDFIGSGDANIGGDLYMGGDEAGEKFRRDGFMTWDEHFDVSSHPSGWAFAGTPFVAAPTYSYNIASHLAIGGTATAGERVFLYKTGASTAWTVWVSAMLTLSNFTAGAYAGVRVDDNSDQNYVEYVIAVTTAAPTAWKVQVRYRTGNGAVNTIDGATGFVAPQTLILSLDVEGTRWSNWSTISALKIPGSVGMMYSPQSGPTGLGWTPQRYGLVYYDGGSARTWEYAYFDAFNIN